MFPEAPTVRSIIGGVVSLGRRHDLCSWWWFGDSQQRWHYSRESSPCLPPPSGAQPIRTFMAICVGACTGHCPIRSEVEPWRAQHAPTLDRYFGNACRTLFSTAPSSLSSQHGHRAFLTKFEDTWTPMLYTYIHGSYAFRLGLQASIGDP